MNEQELSRAFLTRKSASLGIGLKLTSLFALFAGGIVVGQIAPQAVTERSTLGQMLGGIWVSVGMPETDAVEQLSRAYSVTTAHTVDGKDTGIYLVGKRDEPSNLLGNFNVRNGRVLNVSTDWTPKIDSSGALGEALFTLLSRLTTPDIQSGWQVADLCSIQCSPNCSTDAGDMVRMVRIVCGQKTISLNITRMNGAAPHVDVSYEIEDPSIP